MRLDDLQKDGKNIPKANGIKELMPIRRSVNTFNRERTKQQNKLDNTQIERINVERIQIQPVKINQDGRKQEGENINRGNWRRWEQRNKDEKVEMSNKLEKTQIQPVKTNQDRSKQEGENINRGNWQRFRGRNKDKNVEMSSKVERINVEQTQIRPYKVNQDERNAKLLEDALKKYEGDILTLEDELKKILKDEDWFNESGRGIGGVNQVIKHFFVYNIEQPMRNPLIARYLGLSKEEFSSTLEGVKNYLKASERVVKNGICKKLENGRKAYYLKSDIQFGAKKGEELGVIVIKAEQKINDITKEYFQSMMPSTLRYFTKQLI